MTNEQLAIRIQAEQCQDAKRGMLATLWKCNTGLFYKLANSYHTNYTERCRMAGD